MKFVNVSNINNTKHQTKRQEYTFLRKLNLISPLLKRSD